MEAINLHEIEQVSGGQVTTSPAGNVPKPGGTLNLPTPTPAPPRNDCPYLV